MQNVHQFADHILEVCSWMKILYFDWTSTEVCFQASNQPYASTGWDNDLAPEQVPAINWIDRRRVSDISVILPPWVEVWSDSRLVKYRPTS